MNIITIAGHLGADPEVRFTSSGLKVTALRVATKARKSAAGEDQTIWWRVTVWGEQFDKMMPYFKKGSAIVVVGELQKPEIFTGREGNPQVSLSITASSLSFSPFGRSGSSDYKDTSYSSKQTGQYASQANDAAAEGEEAGVVSGAADKENISGENISEDEIPF